MARTVNAVDSQVVRTPADRSRDLRQRAAQAASRQREIAKDMENLARRGGQNAQDENSKKTREQLAERKDTLADSVNSLQQDMEQSARAMARRK